VTVGDELQPSTSEIAANEQPQEDISDATSTDPVEGGTSTATDAAAAAAAAASTDAPAEQASAEAAMDTEPAPEAAASTSLSEEQPHELPFQVQITYTDLDGAEAVRVLTQTQPVTRDRQQAETSRFLLFFLCVISV